jgi:nucleotide-binding universal stress UspA family protein
MKKIIIVAMDFSEGAMNALNFAIRAANAIQANVMLVWVDKKKLSGTVYSNAYDPRLEAKKRFEAITEEYATKLKGGKFLYKMRNGKVQKEITNQAKYHDATLIIAGTHGTSGFDEFWIGSNANKIVARAECPVITIRIDEDAVKPVRNILLPLDSTQETRQKVPFVAYLAKCFGAKIQLLNVYSTNVQTVRKLVDEYASQTRKYLDELEVEYSTDSIEAENITSSTIAYAKDNSSDLIAIMTDQESSPMNLFLGPYAQQMVNHSTIPVLSIRSKNIYDHQAK